MKVADGTQKVFIFAENHLIMITWIKSNPFWATLIGVGIVTGIVLLVRYLMNRNKPNGASNEPKPRPTPSDVVEVPTTAPNRFVGNVMLGSAMESAGAGISAGGSGARVGQNVSR